MYRKILVPLDGSELSECVLPHVTELARGCEIKNVVLMRVCEPPTIPADYPASLPATWEEHVRDTLGLFRQQCSLYLQGVEKRLEGVGIVTRLEPELGPVAEKIVDYAGKNGIDLIVMASHGRSGVSRWAYGSVADKVLRSTCVPVLMIRAPGCIPGV